MYQATYSRPPERAPRRPGALSSVTQSFRTDYFSLFAREISFMTHYNDFVRSLGLSNRFILYNQRLGFFSGYLKKVLDKNLYFDI
jgi:hypothetical protein